MARKPHISGRMSVPHQLTDVRIDEDVVDEFEEKGFLVLRDVLSDDQINRLIDAGDRLIASDYGVNRQSSDDGRYDGFRNCLALDDAFVELLAHPETFPYVVRLMGPMIELLTTHLIYKKPNPDGSVTDRSPGWHRDFYKAQKSLGDPAIPRLNLKCAYYLTDLDSPADGGTLFVPGSHRLREPLDVPEGADPEGAVQPTLSAGDCVLFENRTWHAGGANVGDRTRKAVMFGYSYVWVQPSDYDEQPPETTERVEERYGDIGRQLIGALPEPEEFDFGYDSEPIRDWADTHEIPDDFHAKF